MKSHSSEEAKVTAGQTIPMTGNEAIARGAWEAGVCVAAAYPGTPSTEIMEALASYPAADLTAQWSTNEKVACDVAIGASFAGVRAIAAMKHVGLNVAADAIMSQTYIGVNGGLVLVVCDDPGIHSSQNEQDTRLFARMANIPVLEPSDAQEALDYTRLAFELSERFDTPIIVRGTTRLSHTRSAVRVGERTPIHSRGFDNNTAKNVMIPMHARLRHPCLLEREAAFADWLESGELTRIENISVETGIITSSICYAYVKEIIPAASVLKLGASYPLPEQTIRQFCEAHEQVLIVEELEPVLEQAIKAMGFAVAGKKFFPRVGELSPEAVRLGLEKAGVLAPRPGNQRPEIIPMVRPPVLCAGCPHTSSFMILRAINARVAGDIGCYTLAATEPLNSIDSTVSMGSSIANAQGMARASVEERPVVATIGDSTFLHSGIPALIDAVYNKADITVLLLDNHITAMTGGQDHPGTGRTLRGDETHKINYEELIKSLGVQWVKTCDAYDFATLMQTVREATEYRGVSVVICDRPCVLDPVKIRGPAMQIRDDRCVACQACMNLGCPALSWSDEWHDGHHKVQIDQATCIGCSLCAQVCSANAILSAE